MGELCECVGDYLFEGEEWSDTILSADLTQPPRQAAPDTPSQEGNGLTLYLVQT